MIFGVPRECGLGSECSEKRVGLSPSGARELIEAGADVVIETGAGEAAGFLDEEYRKMGAQIVYSREEAFGRANVVVKVERPREDYLDVLEPGSVMLAFSHLAVTGEEYLAKIKEQRITMIGYEVIRRDNGILPILRISSEIAGKMAPQIAGRLLETSSGGHGILLGGAPGIPPADVVIIGGGNVGYHSARAFLGLGCSVYVLDISTEKLEEIDRYFGGRVVTAHATMENLEKFSAFAEVLVGAVLVPGRLAPVVIKLDMVRKMRPGSVILDFSFDQGGCIETTRLHGPSGGVFTQEGIFHFAVPNCPSYVARTATHSLTHSLLPYLLSMQKQGIKGALKEWSDLRRGCYFYGGTAVNDYLTDEHEDLSDLLERN